MDPKTVDTIASRIIDLLKEMDDSKLFKQQKEYHVCVIMALTNVLIGIVRLMLSMSVESGSLRTELVESICAYISDKLKGSGT